MTTDEIQEIIQDLEFALENAKHAQFHINHVAGDPDFSEACLKHTELRCQKVRDFLVDNLSI